MSSSNTPMIGVESSNEDTNSTTTTSPAATPKSQANHAAIAEYLESVCVGGVTACNDRDFNYENGELYKAVSPTFKAHFENFGHSLTLNEHGHLLRQTIEQYPAYHVEVNSVSSEVDEAKGIAIVYMETEVTGAPPEVKTSLINEFKWRREQGAWRCWLHHGMKGVSEYD
ncbi:hypothetical protein DOTSEDRAFT_82913 [Dothistroma septosporum NZE10]|uniref:SnoaL-like domain-containing protein n=1 Tax=Dothistroma septosporum (strain NZE10 / CBS 128990) TaxID=675120 RepID=N1PG81_DOTSN|nr:hypothetical protein DOTSEDRAFT_82913 [Dothistroma septosporum NZE10]